jgi:hypothetical protein
MVERVQVLPVAPPGTTDLRVSLIPPGSKFIECLQCLLNVNSLGRSASITLAG